jgi:NADPH-dependent 2,4-dienoyl-CoA reductase/sulfur reductase-like enzyme
MYMDKTEVLIVGGSAAGLPAAITARRQYPKARITLIRREKQALIPCGIPYIFGTVGTPDKNLLPDALLQKNNIELSIDEVTSIDKSNKTIATLSGKTWGYDKLILATGSLPLVPKIPGVNLKNVFAAKKDVDYLKGLSTELEIALQGAKSVVVIGGGFIGVEFADEFRKRGLDVTIVEMLPHCLQLVYEEEFSLIAEKKLAERGIKLKLDSSVESILGTEKVEGVRLRSGDVLKADLVFLAIGVSANTKLAAEAGLRLGPQQSVWVDEYMRTSDENIFAIGDCAEKASYFTKKPLGLKLASIATREARIAGANLFQLRRKNDGNVGTFMSSIGDSAIGAVGLTERAAREAGYEPVIGNAAAPDKHPGSMPNAMEMKVKLVFDKPTGVLLGGQVVGGLTCGEVMNILATMIQKRMATSEIATFQLGTHPTLTCSPIAYQIINAAEDAEVKRSS